MGSSYYGTGGLDEEHDLDKAFDGDLDTAYVSKCGPCKRRILEIGIVFPEAVYVNCIRVHQHVYPQHLTTSLTIYQWKGWEWEKIDQTHGLGDGAHGLGGGAWFQRPAKFNNLWRVLNGETVQEWAVRELAFFSDAECRGVIPSRIESSGAWQPTSVGEKHTPTEAAFDKNFETMWKAPCVKEIGGCLSDHAWIGVDFTNTSELHLDVPYARPEVGVKINLTVQCVRIFQHEHPSKQVKTARLQYWTGQDYFTTESLTELGGGTWERRPAKYGSRWRLYGEGFMR